MIFYKKFKFHFAGSAFAFIFMAYSCSTSPPDTQTVSASEGSRPMELLAERPPMGWNSFDAFGASVTEADVMANADMMAGLLKVYGWEYVVVDYCWFFPHSGAQGDPDQKEGFLPSFSMDEYGRLYPAPDKFPSSAEGLGFKVLADYVHDKGLKFGIHMMRGIPREAVSINTKIQGTALGATDIADTSSICRWLNAMYGVDMSAEGAQSYYNSIFDLYACWGVDYVKVDDLLEVRPDGSSQLHHAEIAAIRKAIEQCGRPMVFSFSPGNNTPLEDAEFLSEQTNLWRISGDFWDSWEALKKQFERCNAWSGYTGKGHWPDADMLCLGRLNRRGPGPGLERMTRLNTDEQQTMLSLWCMFRSPLMMGGDLSLIDKQTRALLSNPEVLAINQNSENNRQYTRTGSRVIWIADVPGTGDKYLGFFNIGEEADEITFDLQDFFGNQECRIRDLWQRQDLENTSTIFRKRLEPHASALYRIGILTE